MGSEVLIDTDFNKLGNFSFEEVGRRPYKAYQCEQTDPCNFKDFGFHVFGYWIINSQLLQNNCQNERQEAALYIIQCFTI